MLSSKELVNSLTSNTHGLPDDYIRRAGEIFDKYNKMEEEYKSQLPVAKGRDDRMSPIRKRLMAKMREEITALREEFGLE